jgi:hypothetical protein
MSRTTSHMPELLAITAFISGLAGCGGAHATWVEAFLQRGRFVAVRLKTLGDFLRAHIQQIGARNETRGQRHTLWGEQTWCNSAADSNEQQKEPRGAVRDIPTARYDAKQLDEFAIVEPQCAIGRGRAIHSVLDAGYRAMRQNVLFRKEASPILPDIKLT